MRFVERARAQQIASVADYSSDTSGPTQAVRAFASPYPFTPFLWHVIVETPEFYQLVTVNTTTGRVLTSEQADRFYKPAETADTLAAKQSRGGRVFLDWSMFPIITTPAQIPDHPELTTFTMRDLRFMYDVAFFHGRQNTPLQMRVDVDSSHHAVRAEMDGREQR